MPPILKGVHLEPPSMIYHSVAMLHHYKMDRHCMTRDTGHRTSCTAKGRCSTLADGQGVVTEYIHSTGIPEQEDFLLIGIMPRATCGLRLAVTSLSKISPQALSATLM